MNNIREHDQHSAVCLLWGLGSVVAHSKYISIAYNSVFSQITIIMHFTRCMMHRGLVALRVGQAMRCALLCPVEILPLAVN